MKIIRIHTTRATLDAIEEEVNVYSNRDLSDEIIVDLNEAEMNGMKEYIEDRLGEKIKADYLLLTA